MKLYIVIPHFIINEKVSQLAKNAIKSFKETSDCKIISCDDASPYDSSFLKDISDVYIRNKNNKGFAGNCNVGFKWILDNVKDDCWVVCANNDIEVFPGWFEEFKKTIKDFNGDAIGGLGFKERGIYEGDVKDYNKNPNSKYTNPYISEGGRLEDWMFPGGFYMIKKSLLEECGLYDEGFIHGGYEDVDLFLRWKEAKKRLLITPKVAYWHAEGATRFSDDHNQKGIQSEAETKNFKYFIDKWQFKPSQNIFQFLIDNRINL